MNTGRFVGAAAAVFVVRAILNTGFYGFAMKAQFDAMTAASPGVFRQVPVAYIVLDLLTAILFTYLFVKAGAAFGGGVKGGVSLGLLFAILCPIIGSLYWFFSVTVYPTNMVVEESVYQLVAHAIQGAVAGAIYKSA
jgi:hypothetical protein